MREYDRRQGQEGLTALCCRDPTSYSGQHVITSKTMVAAGTTIFLASGTPVSAVSKMVILINPIVSMPETAGFVPGKVFPNGKTMVRITGNPSRAL